MSEPVKPLNKQVPLKVIMPEDVFLDYADTFAVQSTEDEFVLSFLQVQPPVVMSDLDIRSTEFVECVCLSRMELEKFRNRKMETAQARGGESIDA